jgi:uncharacterized phage protein gp47/JayE
MAFERPTLSTLVTRIKADIKSRTDGDPFLRRSFEAALSKVLAGATHGLYGYLAWIAKQVIPSTADEEMLLRWGQVFGVERNAASKAERVATFEGTNGTTIPAATTFQLADGTQFVSTADATVSAGTANVSIEAVEAGTDANADTGATISLTGPIAGIDTDGLIAASGQVDGSDQEEIEDYRERVLLRIQTPIRGGGVGDYVQWALEVEGVTRAWEYAHYDGVGTVGVAFVRDDDEDLIPSSGERDEVEAYILTKAPIDLRELVIIPLTSQTVSLTIGLSPNTAAVREAVRASIQDLFQREAEPGEATPLESRIREAISTTVGEDDNDLVAISSLVTTAAEINVCDVGSESVAGDITFQDL